MGLSREGRIGIAVGTLVGIALVLIKPEQVFWRWFLLICFGLCLLYVATELDWVNQRNVELSIVHGEICSQSKSPIRLGFASLLAIVLTIAFGFRTWPTRKSTAPMHPYIPPVAQVPIQNPPKKSPQLPLPHAAPQPPVAETAQPPKTKTPTVPAPYPIIVVASTQVTIKDDTHITMTVTLTNETATEVNAHISMQTFAVENGTQTPTGNSEERDIGFAPLPFSYALSRDWDLSASGQIDWTNGNLFLLAVIEVSYPDRGGKTIYHFKGKTVPKLDHLDYIESDWEHNSRP